MAQKGHEIAFLLTVESSDVDSLMFHTANIEIAGQVAECMGIRCIVTQSSPGEELKRLGDAIIEARDNGAEGIVTGAIQSDYQYTRIERLCFDAGIRCFSPLWRKNQLMLLKDVVNAGLKAMIVAIAAEGLDESFLGKTIDIGIVSKMEKLQMKFGVNPSGEGGEYETIVIDSPLHRQRLEIEESEIVKRGQSSLLKMKRIKRIEKAFSKRD